jgi:hypothetical protein
MELVIALMLFIGLITFWTMLPGSTSTHSITVERNRRESQGETTAPAQQPA